jgi:translation initiation factor IF-1
MRRPPADEAGDGRRQVEGRVRAILPRALYRVVTGSGQDILAHVAGGPGKNFVRLVEGDRVVVELATADGRRGRIVRRVPA